LTELADEFSIPRGVGGIPIEDISKDGNALAVDREADLELVEMSIAIAAVSLCDREVVLVVFVLVETLDRFGGGVGVDHIRGHAFTSSSFSHHGSKECREVSFSEHIEEACHSVIVEIVGCYPIFEEILGIGITEELGQPIHRLPFHQEVHDEGCESVSWW